MDYVKETLRRQSAAWLALFGGNETASPEAAEEGGEPSALRQAETEARAVETAARSEAAARVLQDAAAEEPVRERLTGEGERLTGEEEWLTRRSSRAAPTWESGSGGSAAQVTGMESPGAESAQWEAEAALREGRGALETADARAISRRFERDARRYDGGFQFY